MRLASGYANRTESLSLFGSYTAREANVLADHLFRDPDFKGHSFEPENVVCLSAEAEMTDGLFFHGGTIHQTARMFNRKTGRFLDLYPGEEERIDALRRPIAVAAFESGDYAPGRLRKINRTPKQLLDQLYLLETVERRSGPN